MDNNEELNAKLAEAQRAQRLVWQRLLWESDCGLIWEAHRALEDQLDEITKMIEAEAADGE